MDLAAASSYFDDVPLSDAYSGVLLGLGQIAPNDGAVRDGMVMARRTLSTAPDVIMPQRHAVTIEGTTFIASDTPDQDYFQGAVIRNVYTLHRSDGLAEVKPIAQELSGIVGNYAHAAVVWLKGTKEIDESSRLINYADIYFAKDNGALVGQLVKLNGGLFLVREQYTTVSGFDVSVVDQLDTPSFETANYTSRVYDPLTDSHTSLINPIVALRLRWQTKFEYLSSGSTKYVSGDDVVIVLASAVPSPTTGDFITLSDGIRRVESIQAEGDLWHLHVRRA